MTHDVVRVVLTRLEGFSWEVDRPVEVSTLENADTVLAWWSRTAPERGAGYDKVRVVVTYRDGGVRIARHDLQRMAPWPDLERHLERVGHMLDARAR